MSQKLGAIATELFNLKQQKSELNSKVTELNKQIKEIEVTLLQEMQNADVVKFSTGHGGVYVNRQVVPKVVEWDKFYKYIAEHKYFHLLERRPSKSGYKEFYELGENIPGVEAVVFDEVRTRKS